MSKPELKFFAFLDDSTYAAMDDAVVLIAQPTEELQDFIDNDPNLNRIDRDCPRTYYCTVDVADLWDAFLQQNPDALAELLNPEPDEEPEISDKEIMRGHTDWPPDEWDVPGSADYVLTHQQGTAYDSSNDEPDEVEIMEKYGPREKSYACTKCGARFGDDEDEALRHTDPDDGECPGYEYESVE